MMPVRFHAALIGLAALVGGCSAQVDTGRTVLGSNPATDFAARVQSVEELKFAGIVRQQFDFSCGSAALATLLGMYGDPYGEEAAFNGMWRDGDRAQIQKLGFSLLDMKRYLETKGMKANGYKVSLDQIGAAGVPGIALVTINGYRHFVVIEGMRAREVLVADPALGRRATPADEFSESWNGVFFVIDTALDRGRGQFNDDVRWASYNRAPLGSRFTDPVSLQALALTAPFYRDF